MESQESNLIENNSSTAVLENTETDRISSDNQSNVNTKKEVFILFSRFENFLISFFYK